MKILDVTSNFALQLLNEANVINIKDDFGEDYSIVTYLERFTNELPGELQKPFIKKISRLLVNDENYLYAVRQLPDEAPEWARTAMENGELMYFKPDEQLQDSLQNIVHYLSTATERSKGDNNDEKVAANKELQGWTKAESIDVLINKANEYFKRGTKKAIASIEGMVELMQVGEYTWYLLKTGAAYQAAGKVLQNCIGSHWTVDKTTRQNQSIVVLQGPSGGLHVAARINNNDNEVQEMKGKNNRPPVEKYMAPVIQFIQNKNLSLSGIAISDFRNAGYIYDEREKVVLTKAMAIKKYFSMEKVADHDSYQIYEMSYDSATSGISTRDAADIIKAVYSNLDINVYREDIDGLKIYEMRKGDKRLVVGKVDGAKVLQKIATVTSEQINESYEILSSDSEGTVFVKALLKAGLIEKLGNDISNFLFWNQKSRYDVADSDDGRTIRSVASDTIKTTTPDIVWSKLDSEEHIGRVVDAVLLKATENKPHPLKQALEDNSAEVAFLAKVKKGENEHTNLAAVLVDGVLYPAMVSTAGSTDSDSIATSSSYEYDRDPVSNRPQLVFRRDKNRVEAYKDLANKIGAKLYKSFRIVHGIVQNDDGKYDIADVKPQDVGTEDVRGKKFDLSKLTPVNRLAALSHITTNKAIRQFNKHEDTERDDDLMHTPDTRIYSRAMQTQTGKMKPKDEMMYRKEISDTAIGRKSIPWKNKVSDVFEKLYGGNVEAAYIVTVKYGANKEHNVLLFASKKKIHRMDDTSAEHDYQQWDDYSDIAKQLNKFALSQGLTFEKDSVDTIKEFRVRQGKLMSGTQVQQERLSSMKERGDVGREDTDSIPFRDGHTLQRVNPEDQGNWARRALKTDSLLGEAWVLKSPTGASLAVVQVKKGVVQGMFMLDLEGSDETDPEDAIELEELDTRRSNVKYMEYVQGAMKQFGWKVKNVAQFVIKPMSVQHSMLTKLTNGRMTDRGNLYRATGFTKVKDWHSPHAADRNLYEYGLIDYDAGDDAISITELGQQILSRLEEGQSVNLSNLAKPKDLDPSWQAPEAPLKPKPKAEPQQRGTKTGRANKNSKSQQALDKFMAMTDEKKGDIPTRAEFMKVLQDAPFNMTRSGAQTYYYTTKAKYQKQQKRMSESNELEWARAQLLKTDSKPFSAIRSMV